MDTSIPDQIVTASQQIKDLLKTKNLKLQAIVCSAGLTQMNPFEADDMDLFNKIFATNV